jgi:hypothetical protein
MPEAEFSLTEGTSGGEGGKAIRLPHKSIQAEYLISILMVISKFDGVLADLKSTNDPRPPILARQIINRILDDDIRYELLDKFDQKQKEIREKFPTADEQMIEIIRVSQDIAGEANSYLDEYFAIHKGQEIGDV